VGAELIAAMSGLRRALRRRVGQTGGVSELTDAQRELVRVVRRRPGIRVGAAAGELHLAPNTVSTLVGVLSENGWLHREVDPLDARSAGLHLTAEAEQRVSGWRDLRLAILTEALDGLAGSDRLQIERAVPILMRLATHIEEQS